MTLFTTFSSIFVNFGVFGHFLEFRVLSQDLGLILLYPDFMKFTVFHCFSVVSTVVTKRVTKRGKVVTSRFKSRFYPKLTEILDPFSPKSARFHKTVKNTEITGVCGHPLGNNGCLDENKPLFSVFLSINGC